MTIAALLNGKGVLHSHDYATADYSGRCKEPLIVDQMGYPHQRIDLGNRGEREPSRTLSMKVRCRGCDGCHKERRAMWTARALTEWKQSTRSWFVTLTFHPEKRYQLRAETSQRLRKQGVDLDRLPARERFSELLNEAGREVSLYLMRLRKGEKQRGWKPLRFRYFLVAEPHKSGDPHFHLVVHEIAMEMPVVKTRIEETWPHGIVHARLIKTPEVARYVVKYLGKGFDGRIRASKLYGRLEVDPAAAMAAPYLPGYVAGHPAPLSPVLNASRDGTPNAALSEPGEEFEGAGFRPPGAPMQDQPGQCPLGLHDGVACDCAVAVESEGGWPWATEGPDSELAVPPDRLVLARRRRGFEDA